MSDSVKFVWNEVTTWDLRYELHPTMKCVSTPRVGDRVLLRPAAMIDDRSAVLLGLADGTPAFEFVAGPKELPFGAAKKKGDPFGFMCRVSFLMGGIVVPTGFTPLKSLNKVTQELHNAILNALAQIGDDERLNQVGGHGALSPDNIFVSPSQDRVVVGPPSMRSPPYSDDLVSIHSYLEESVEVVQPVASTRQKRERDGETIATQQNQAGLAVGGVPAGSSPTKPQR